MVNDPGHGGKFAKTDFAKLEEHALEMRLGEMRLGEMRLGEMRLGEMRLGEMRLGEMRLGEMRLGEMRLGLPALRFQKIGIISCSISKSCSLQVYLVLSTDEYPFDASEPDARIALL